MIKPRSQPITRSKWFLPLFSLGLGIVVLAVFWLLATGGVAYLAAVVFLRWRG